MDQLGDNHHFKQNLINFSILSVSLLISMGNAISPALPSIAKSFPSIPLSIVDMIGTIQQFAVLLALFVSVAVARKIGIKYTIMTGIFLVGISGLIPMFFNSFFLIMLSRIVLGCGIGFFNSLAIDIINVYFKGHEKERVKMCGIRTSFEPLGQCILNFACGFLVMINWHVAFGISLAAIPVFLLYWKYVPNIHEGNAKPAKSKPKVHKSHAKVSLGIYILAALLMFLVMCNTAITIEVPNIVSNLHLGNSAFSSLIISLNTLAAMFMGFEFSRMYGVLHRYTLSAGFVLIALGSLIMFFSRGSFMVILGAIVSGISFPLSGSYVYALIGKVASKTTAALAISVVLVGCNLGSFICPIGVSVLGRIGRFLDPSASMINSAFMMMFFLSFIVAIVMISITSYKYKQSSLRVHPNKMLG